MKLALVLLALALAGRWTSHIHPGGIPSVLAPLLAIAFFAFAVGRLLRFVMSAVHDDVNVLCAGLSGYLILGLMWRSAYVLVAQINPKVFAFGGDSANAVMEGFNALYFSFVTLCYRSLSSRACRAICTAG